MVMVLGTMSLSAGCSGGPDKDMVKQTVGYIATKQINRNIWEVSEITLDNSWKQRNPLTGLDMHVYEVTVVIKAKTNFIKRTSGFSVMPFEWEWKSSNSDLEDVFPSKRIEDDQGRVYGKGTTRHYSGEIGFSKEGKEWRYYLLGNTEMFGLISPQTFKKQISQNAF